MPSPTAPPAPIRLLEARDLGLVGPRGPVFRHLDLTLDHPGLIAVSGPVGSGRTCLLLTLAARMRHTEGHLAVAGQDLPRHRGAVQRLSALAEIPGVNDLDPRMTVAEHLHERLALLTPWWHLGLVRASRTRTGTQRLLRRVDDLDPDPADGELDAPVAALEAPRRWRLGLALALAGSPALVLVDDLDALGDSDDVARAWFLLRALADSGVGVVAACTDATRIPDGVADDVVALTTETGGTTTTGLSTVGSTR